MTISVTDIGTNSNTSGATVAVTVGVGGVPSGALIVVCICEQGSSTVGGSVADTAGNTYASAVSQTLSPGATAFMNVFYAFNASALVSTNTITYTKQTSGDRTAISAFYATGIQTSPDPLDGAVTASAKGSSSAPSVTSGTPGASGELFVGVVGVSGETTDTFTQDSTNGAYATPPTRVGTSGAGLDPVVAGGNLVNSGSSAKTYAPSITSRAWGDVIVGFKAAAAGGVTYPELERGIRGLERGVVIGGY